MLTDINIHNFALIDELDLELGKGMCVLTGETGAGKSIVVDALGMVLGDRAESTTIRLGASRAEITLGLDVSQLADVKSWLQEHDLGRDDRCILRRVINRDGPSKAYINDSPATVTVLKSLGEMLVDIHGQHEHQSLLRRDVQRQLLDNHAGNERRLAQLAALYRTWQGVNMKLQSLLANSGDHQSRADLLRFQIQELETLALREGELETLASEHQRLANAERLQSSCMQAYSALYESDDASIYTQLAGLVHELDDLHNLDDVLGEYHDLLVDAQLQIQEAANGIRRYSERLVNDRQQLEQVENRITAIHDLARKHRVAAEELPQALAHMQRDLATLENPEYDLAKVRARLQEVDADYR
ncbi:MAG: DNA repair protein RecN, partial [Gammaproteobacteria bacterium]